MKKIVNLLIFLFVTYFIIQIGLRFLDNGHVYEYSLNKEQKFYIKEVLTQNKKNEKNNYYFEIDVNDTKFNIQTFNTYNRATAIIKDIKYFSNSNYICILPILYNKELLTDIICKKEDKYYYYNSLKGNDAELDKFASDNLNLENYKDNDTIVKKTNNLYVYKNIVSNHSVTLDNYKGIFIIDFKSRYTNINLFNEEKYNHQLGCVVGKYYVSANYDEEYEFHNIRIVNLDSYATSKFTSDYAISFDSYIQGIIGNSVYLFDKTNKKQYRINVENKEVIQIGNENGIKIYDNDEFINGNAYEASNRDILFNESLISNEFNGKQYYRVEKKGNNDSGYYYIYEKEKDKYNIYRASIQNSDILTYLFTTSDIDSIQYVDNYIYFKDSIYIKYFNELTGIKTLVRYNNMEFNNDLKFYVYSK